MMRSASVFAKDLIFFSYSFRLSLPETNEFIKFSNFRKDISKEIYSKKEDLFGVITDTKLDMDVAQFSFSQIEEVVDLIEEKFLQDQIE